MEAGEYLVDADTSGAIWSIAQSLDDGAIWILGGFVGTWGAWDSGPELDAFVIALPEDLSAARWSRQIQLQGSQTEAIVSNGEIAVASDRVWVGVPFSSTAVVETEMSTAAGAFDGLVVAHRRDTGARLVTEQLGATDTATITAVHVFEDQLFLGGSLRGSMSHPSPLSGAPLGTISAFLVASEAAP
jgi:hypothetical protein